MHRNNLEFFLLSHPGTTKALSISGCCEQTQHGLVGKSVVFRRNVVVVRSGKEDAGLTGFAGHRSIAEDEGSLITSLTSQTSTQEINQLDLYLSNDVTVDLA